MSVFEQASIMNPTLVCVRDQLLIVMGACLAFAAAAQEQRMLSVEAYGFVNARGRAVAKLFEPGDSVRGHSRQEHVAVITNRKASFQFANLVPGRYAIVVFHDENNNNEIDHNTLRLPTEALGFSGGYAMGLFSGLPNFEKLAFSYDKPLSILRHAP